MWRVRGWKNDEDKRHATRCTYALGAYARLEIWNQITYLKVCSIYVRGGLRRRSPIGATPRRRGDETRKARHAKAQKPSVCDTHLCHGSIDRPRLLADSQKSAIRIVSSDSSHRNRSFRVVNQSELSVAERENRAPMSQSRIVLLQFLFKHFRTNRKCTLKHSGFFKLLFSVIIIIIILTENIYLD